MPIRPNQADAFSVFAAARRSDLQRIARHTRGESTLEDVEAEAWLMVHDLAGKGTVLDLGQPDHQKLLLSHLYQNLVRYTELHVRNGVRLDHAPGGEEGEAHPLMNMLSAAEHYDPAVLLERAQTERLVDDSPSPHLSLAAAYVHLVRRFNNCMRDVAQHLLISVSYCRQRCAHARTLATHQQPLPPAALPTDSTFSPKPWRRFRLERKQVQLRFDFGEEVQLFESEAPNVLA